MTSDIYETNVNMTLGCIINCVLTYIIFDVTPQFALGSTAIFFFFSWVRSYWVRRYFRSIEVVDPSSYTDISECYDDCDDILPPLNVNIHPDNDRYTKNKGFTNCTVCVGCGSVGDQIDQLLMDPCRSCGDSIIMAGSGKYDYRYKIWRIR